MSQSLAIIFITIGGLVFMEIIAVVFIKIMINTTKYANREDKRN